MEAGGGEFRCAGISKYGGKLANALTPEGNDKTRENGQNNHSRALESDKKTQNKWISGYSWKTTEPQAVTVGIWGILAWGCFHIPAHLGFHGNHTREDKL